MRAVVMRVIRASVESAGEVLGAIETGLLVLAAVARDDTDDDRRWIASKLAGLRVFPSADRSKEYDRDVMTAAGAAVLVISNFTILGDATRGRRPGFDLAMPPVEAAMVWSAFLQELAEAGLKVQAGRFGADMIVRSDNDGPSTFVLDSKGRL